MRPFIPLLLLASAALPAAVSLDIDVAAWRGGADAARFRAEAAERPFFPRLTAAAREFEAETGVDPRQALRRVQAGIDDAGHITLVISGLPAETLAGRIATAAPRAQTRILAADVLAIGVAGTPAPEAAPTPLAGPGSPFAVHATPRPQPLLPIMARIRSLDVRGTGAGHLTATIQAVDAGAAADLEQRLVGLRDRTPALLAARLSPPAKTVLASLAVSRYDTVVTAVVDASLEDRIALLRLASARLAARLPAHP